MHRVNSLSSLSVMETVPVTVGSELSHRLRQSVSPAIALLHRHQFTFISVCLRGPVCVLITTTNVIYQNQNQKEERPQIEDEHWFDILPKLVRNYRENIKVTDEKKLCMIVAT